MEQSDDVRSTAWLKAAALLILAFWAGATAGVLGDRLVLLRQQRLLPKEGLEVATNRAIRQLNRRLDLTDEQERRIREIVDNHKTNIETISREFRPRVRKEMETADREIRAVLDEAQKAEYDELRNKWRRRAKWLTGAEE